MTPQELKNSILQLAVQGKLVPQRPEEGSAEELLAAIRAQKQSSDSRSTVRKKKNSHKDTETRSDVPADEIPFEIPASWKWVRLGEISSYSEPKEKISASKIKPNTWSLDLEDIEKETGRIIKKCVAAERKISGDKVCFRKGQILYSKLRPYLKKILVAPSAGVCTSEIVPFSVYGSIVPEYIISILKSPHIDQLVNTASYGMKMPRVGTETMLRLLIPLPPLAEQKRIVAKIEELLPLCECYGNAYNELQALNKRVPCDLQKSLLQLAVQGKLVPQHPEEGSAEELLTAIRAQKQSSDSRSTVRKKKNSHKDTETQSNVPADEIPFEIPETWKWVRLGEIAFSCLGKMLDRQKNIGIPMPYLRNVNVRWGSFDLSDLLEMKFENVTEKRFLVKKGDLVMCEGGEPGRCAIWESEDAIHFQKALHRIRFQECVDVYFSYRIFEFYAKSGFLNNLFTGTTIKHLTGQVLKEIPFPLPPLAEQKRIVAKLEELLPLCNQLSL